jgi:hypothetical protein
MPSLSGPRQQHVHTTRLWKVEPLRTGPRKGGDRPGWRRGVTVLPAAPAHGCADAGPGTSYDRPVPDDVEIATALVEVYRAWWTAHDDVVAYEAAVKAERLALFPDPGGRWDEAAALQRRQWPPEQTAELDRLRALREQAFHAMTGHPLVVQAREAKTWKAVSAALQKQMLAQQEHQQP